VFTPAAADDKDIQGSEALSDKSFLFLFFKKESAFYFMADGKRSRQRSGEAAKRLEGQGGAPSE
jgi:hypothetical protein